MKTTRVQTAVAVAAKAAVTSQLEELALGGGASGFTIYRQ
jgi:hypothetical protein